MLTTSFSNMLTNKIISTIVTRFMSRPNILKIRWGSESQWRLIVIGLSLQQLLKLSLIVPKQPTLTRQNTIVKPTRIVLMVQQPLIIWLEISQIKLFFLNFRQQQQLYLRIEDFFCPLELAKWLWEKAMKNIMGREYTVVGMVT